MNNYKFINTDKEIFNIIKNMVMKLDQFEICILFKKLFDNDSYEIEFMNEKYTIQTYIPKYKYLGIYTHSQISDFITDKIVVGVLSDYIMKENG